MESHTIPWAALAWFGGWLVATSVLWLIGINLPLNPPGGRWRRARAWLLLPAALGSAVLANVALSLHDGQFDLTAEKLFTPAAPALAVVDRLTQPVDILYFYSGDSPDGKRARDILEAMHRRNPWLTVRAADPDRDPQLAANYGVKIYNTAVITAQGRQIMVRGTDETDIAIGIQRVLRERLVIGCFAEGHGEYASTNYEFHTHLDSAVGHSHDATNSGVVDTTAHGYGRLRRSLEGLGYEVQVISLARPAGIPPECNLVIDAGPRTTYLPAESAALSAYAASGGSVLLMFDLGFELEPNLAALMRQWGVELPQAVVLDPSSHYGRDASQVAITHYMPHAITRNVSYTFYPGVRPLRLHAVESTLKISPLFSSSENSARQPLASAEQRAVVAAPANSQAQVGPQVLAAAIEGQLTHASKPFRAVVIGDADFVSNSFYPYVANSDLALATIRWLLREDSQVAIASRIPVPPVLVLTKPQMMAVFALVEGLVPLLVIALGVGVWWKRR